MNIHDVDLRHLKVFAAIVECEGLSAAETRLNIGRSAISTHLADLEIRLGVTLCTRGRKGFKLTEQGKVVYQATRSLFQQCEVFVSTIADSKSKLTGSITISMIDMTINDERCCISQAISKLKSRGGHVHIEVKISAPDEVELAVLNGQSTIGIGISRHPLRGLSYEPLYNEMTYLYCGIDHPLFHAKSHKLNKLLKESEFVSRGYMRGPDPFGADLPCKKTATAYHEESIAHLILSGQYIGYLPEQFAQIWINKKTMKAILPNRYCYKTPVVLITPKSNALPVLVSTLIKDIQSAHNEIKK